MTAEKEKSTYRVAIIGCGRIARLHAIGYMNHPRCEIAALCDIDEKKAEAFAEERDLSPALYTDHEEMLRKEQPDIVSVCLWPELHLPAVRACVEAGTRAVHCEKPMAATWGEALAIADVAAGGNTQLTFNHQRRFNPRYQKAQELLDSGRFGTIERVEAWNPAHILDCGSHLIDFIFMYNHENPVKWVLGQIDAREVKDWFGVPFEFAAVGILRSENGVRATLHSGDDKEMGWGVRLSASEGIIEIGGGDGETVRVFGPDTSGWEEILTELSGDDRKTAMMVGVFEDIIQGLETGKEPELSVRRALQATEVIFAIYESSRSRARIDLPLESRDSAFLTMLEQGTIGPAEAAGS